MGLTGLIGGLVLYTAGLAMRAYIAGRAPWSNMYESLLAIGWAAVVIALIYELVRRDRVFGMVGALWAAVALSIAQFASLDRGINPLVPALQSYWLNYHVIITLSGYAAFALTMGLGHAVLIAGVNSRGEVTPRLAQLAKANLRIMQVGCLLLVTGILLGAVWANVSLGAVLGLGSEGNVGAHLLVCVYRVFARAQRRLAGLARAGGLFGGGVSRGHHDLLRRELLSVGAAQLRRGFGAGHSVATVRVSGSGGRLFVLGARETEGHRSAPPGQAEADSGAVPLGHTDLLRGNSVTPNKSPSLPEERPADSAAASSRRRICAA